MLNGREQRLMLSALDGFWAVVFRSAGQYIIRLLPPATCATGGPTLKGPSALTTSEQASFLPLTWAEYAENPNLQTVCAKQILEQFL